MVRKAYSIRNNLIDLALSGDITENEFYKISSLLAPQSRSPLWENYFRTKQGCKKVHKNKNRGDFEKDGKFYEYKASGYSADNAVNIVQIRLWQNCDYVVQYISDDGVNTFVLTHSEMAAETEKLNASSAHGTKEVTEDSRYVELRMTLKPGTEDWQRWLTLYEKTFG